MNNQELSKRNDDIIKGFVEKFSINKEPIEVSFRKILPEIKNIDRFTHLIHTYPAKLLVHIPYFFLNNSILSKEGDTVLDPFNGSGTVLLETMVANKIGYGADANPLARLIAEVKTSKLQSEQLFKVLKITVATAKRYTLFDIPDVVNCDYWFSEKAKIELSKLLRAINNIENEPIKKFMLISFSNCVKKVSYADQRVSVPVKLNPKRYNVGSDERKKIGARLKALKNISVFEKFNSITCENIERFKKLEGIVFSGNAKIISDDARRLTKKLGGKELIPDSSIQLIITSPPYAGAQKYIRASSLNLGWTNLAKTEDLAALEQQNIGRESYRKSQRIIKKIGIKGADLLISTIFKINPLRAQIVCSYLDEMKVALNEMVRVLKKQGYLVLIVGNNKVCNLEFNTQEYFTEYLKKCGLKLQFKLIDDIQSYGLMTKRNKTADIISREWILVFKK